MEPDPVPHMHAEVFAPKLPPLRTLKMNAVVQVLSVLFMAAALYMLWRSDQRASKSDARFHDTLHTLQERVRVQPGDTRQDNGSRFHADSCTGECAEGHTYKLGCIQYVKPEPDANITETL